jgi:polygalacturonase
MVKRCFVVIGSLALLGAASTIAQISTGPVVGRDLAASRNLADQTSAVSVNPQLPVIPPRKFVITDFGAVGDGKTLNTEAFRKAIAACREAAGGDVIVPAGVFVTAPITLASHMAFVIGKGATVRGSGDFRDYEKAAGGSAPKEPRTSVLPLIGGANLADVEICGEGAIDGASEAWWKRFRAERTAGVPQQGQPRAPGQPVETPRPILVWLADCTRVHIQGVSLRNSPQFHLVPQRCRDVLIEDVSIIAPSDSPNTDAIDPTGSSNVLIRRCFIDVGDDHVSFKSNPKDAPTENILVSDCTFKHGHGTSVGSNVGGGIRNITVERCTFEGSDNGIRIKSARDRGGVVENIIYRDITMKNVGVAITINLFYFDKEGQKERVTKPVTPTTPIVRGVRVVNVSVDEARTAGEIVGLPEMPVSDVLLDNVSIKSKTGMIVQDARSVEFHGVHIVPQKGEPLTIAHADVKTTNRD